MLTDREFCDGLNLRGGCVVYWYVATEENFPRGCDSGGKEGANGNGYEEEFETERHFLSLEMSEQSNGGFLNFEKVEWVRKLIVVLVKLLIDEQRSRCQIKSFRVLFCLGFKSKNSYSSY